jgi:hypothetical protein
MGGDGGAAVFSHTPAPLALRQPGRASPRPPHTTLAAPLARTSAPPRPLGLAKAAPHPPIHPTAPSPRTHRLPPVFPVAASPQPTLPVSVWIPQPAPAGSGVGQGQRGAWSKRKGVARRGWGQRSPEGARRHTHPETTGFEFVVGGDIRVKRCGDSVGLPHIQAQSGGIPWSFLTYRRKAGKFRGAFPHPGEKWGTPSIVSELVALGWARFRAPSGAAQWGGVGRGLGR